MPGHFGRYNFAICRRLCRSAVARNSERAESPVTNGNSAIKEDDPKKKKKKAKSSNNNENNHNINNGDANGKHQSVDYDRANEEWNNLIATLRMLNIDVIQLGPDEDLDYESVFIGDTAVMINGLALMCRPRDRLKELKQVKQIITSELNLPVIEINDETALLNGGDVLWTGREIFVGLSNETNEPGARAVAAAFPEYSVTPVRVPSQGNLRLRSYITMAGPDILCTNKSPEAQHMLRRMEREASYKYKLITLDDEQGSNVLYINGTLLHRNDLEDSVAVLQDRVESRVPVKISELTKNHPFNGIDSLCLMVRRSHRMQTIV